MNKKIFLKASVIFVISLLLTPMLYINAEETTTPQLNSENINQEQKQTIDEASLENSENTNPAKETILINIEEIVLTNQEEKIESLEENFSIEDISLISKIEEKFNETTDLKEEVNKSENLEEILENIQNESIIYDSTNTKISSEEKNTELIEIDKLIDEVPKENENELPKPQEKTKLIILDKNREIKINIDEAPIDTRIDSITYKEILLNEEEGNWEKEATIKSEEHLNAPLIFYSEIKEVSIEEKETIHVYWKNEDKEIEIEEYIDSDNNGKYDKISWVVPHLSEQIFEIRINFETIDDTSKNITLNISSQVNGEVDNPINFQIEINYSDTNSVECNLNIEDETFFEFNTTSPTIENLNFQNGDYDWTIYCEDKLNNSINNSLSGEFTINEETFNILDKLNTAYLNGTHVTFSIPSNYTNTTVILTKPNLDKETFYFTTNLINISKEKIALPGIYSLQINAARTGKPIISETKNFTAGELKLSFSEGTIQTNQNIPINVYANFSHEIISLTTIDFGNGNNYSEIYSDSFNKQFLRSYSQIGTYIIKATIHLTSGLNFTIQKNGITVINSNDTTAPEVNLISPENKANFYDGEISFIYKATDNVKVNNCTFFLWFGETEDYRTINSTIINGEEAKIILTNFEVGNYTWDVDCYDNSSNLGSATSKKFNILSNMTTISVKNSSTDYDKKEFLKDTQERLDDFMKKDFSPEETNLLDDLEIMDNLKYFQKKLIQIDQDLGTNLKFISDVSTREERRKELENELNEISKEIPEEITITNTKEFVKNSQNENLEEKITQYLKLKNPELSEREIKNLAKTHFANQNQISVSTSVINAEIRYLSKTKTITAIVKEILLKDENAKIVEMFPEKISETITIVNENKEISTNSIFEIDGDDLIENKLIYYVEGKIDEPENIETLLIKNVLVNDLGLTGFFVLGTDTLNTTTVTIIILGICILIYISFFVKRKLKELEWKTETNAIKTKELIKDTKSNILRGEIESAKEKYRKIKELYPLLQEDCKKKFYKEIGILQTAIDKREITALIKEYFKAKEEIRKEDAQLLYENIKKVYKRLPKKYQQQAYDKIFKTI